MVWFMKDKAPRRWARSQAWIEGGMGCGEVMLCGIGGGGMVVRVGV